MRETGVGRPKRKSKKVWSSGFKFQNMGFKKNNEELDRLRNKKLFLIEFTEAVEELKQIKEGKKFARNAEDFLNDL